MDTLEYPNYPYLDACGTLEWVEGVGKLIEPFYTNGSFTEYSVSVDCYVYEGESVAIPGYLDSICTPLVRGEVAIKSKKVYPNPSDGLIRILGYDKASIEVYDLSGRMILSPSIFDGQVDLRSLPSGYYVIRFGQDFNRVVID
jgi:hypothetical protein